MSAFPVSHLPHAPVSVPGPTGDLHGVEPSPPLSEFRFLFHSSGQRFMASFPVRLWGVFSLPPELPGLVLLFSGFFEDRFTGRLRWVPLTRDLLHRTCRVPSGLTFPRRSKILLGPSSEGLRVGVINRETEVGHTRGSQFCGRDVTYDPSFVSG